MFVGLPIPIDEKLARKVHLLSQKLRECSISISKSFQVICNHKSRIDFNALFIHVMLRVFYHLNMVKLF
jgi:hypothetical protein